jgi:hypothetical protein
MVLENGRNHWRIEKIVCYYPDKDITDIPNFKISKNVYGQPIQGRPLRVIAQLMQIEHQNKFEKNQLSKDLILGTMRWVSIVDDLEQVRNYLRRWADNHYKEE